MAAAKKSVLSSLAVYAEDSEPESDSEAGGISSERGTQEEKGGLVSEGYGEDDFSKMDGEEDGYDEDDEKNSKQSEEDDSETEKPEADDLKDHLPVSAPPWKLHSSEQDLLPVPSYKWAKSTTACMCVFSFGPHPMEWPPKLSQEGAHPSGFPQTV